MTIDGVVEIKRSPRSIKRAHGLTKVITSLCLGSGALMFGAPMIYNGLDSPAGKMSLAGGIFYTLASGALAAFRTWAVKESAKEWIKIDKNWKKIQAGIGDKHKGDKRTYTNIDEVVVKGYDEKHNTGRIYLTLTIQGMEKPLQTEPVEVDKPYSLREKILGE